MRKTIILFVLSLFQSENGLFAQSRARQSSNNYTFKNISQENTTISRIHDIVQDDEGLMWFGSLSGLYRYDGLSFKSYQSDAEDSTSLPNNDIRSFLVDQDGAMWIASFNNLSKYDRITDSFVKVAERGTAGLWSHHFITLAQSRDGTIWAGTTRGLSTIIDGVIRRFQGLPENKRIWSLAVDRLDRIWVGMEHDIYIIDEDRQVSQVSVLSDFKIENTFCLITAHDGSVWVGTSDFGLYHIEETKQDSLIVTSYRHDPFDPSSLGADNVLDLYQDRTGNVWISAENGGLNLYDPRSDDFVRFVYDPGDPNSVSSNSIWDIYEDRDGRLWLGTFNNGIDLYDPLGEKFYRVSQATTANRLTHNSITCFDFIGDNQVWIGTDGGGINVWDREIGEFSYFQLDHLDENSLGSSSVLRIYQDSHDEVWIGTWQGGLNRYIPSTNDFVRYTNDESNPHSISSDYVFDIIEDAYDRLWIGTFRGGVNVYDRNSGRFFNITNDGEEGKALSSSEIIALVNDQNKYMWVGAQQGLDRVQYDSTLSYSVTRFRHDSGDPKSLASDFINDVYQDTKARIWVATQEGLCLFLNDEDGFMRIDESDGLASLEAQAIIQDKNGGFWVTTSDGISHMTEIQPGVFSFRNYNANDGLQGNTFNRYSAAISDEGEIFLGGTNGFNHFFIEQVQENKQLPYVILTDIKLFNKSINYRNSDILETSIDAARELTFNYLQTVFTLEYTGVSLTGADKNEYAYRMVGFEDEWNYVGKKRSATYTNLDPGTYVFQVKASNSDGYWSNKAKEVAIIILPPWWETWWFRTLIIILGLSTIGLIYIRRTAKVKEQRLLLEQKIREATEEISQQNKKLEDLSEFKEGMTHMIAHDMKNSLAAIIGLSSLEPVDQKMQHIHDNSNVLLNLVSNMLDVRKFKESQVALTLESMIGGVLLRKAATRTDTMYQMRSMNIKTQIKHDVVLSIDKEIMIRVIVNLLNNACKYSRPGQTVDLVLEVVPSDKEPLCSISVIDRGSGIDEENLPHLFEEYWQGSSKSSGISPSTGLGLTFCKMAVEAHGGDIRVASIPNKETIFSILLPLDKHSWREISLETSENGPDQIIKEKDSMIVREVVEKIRRLEVYDIGKIQPEINKLIAANVTSQWKVELEAAVVSGDQTKFKQLIDEVDRLGS